MSCKSWWNRKKTSIKKEGPKIDDYIKTKADYLEINSVPKKRRVPIFKKVDTKYRNWYVSEFYVIIEVCKKINRNEMKQSISVEIL